MAARRAGDVALDPVWRRTTQPSESTIPDQATAINESPRLFGIETDPHLPELTAFERKALLHFKSQPDSAPLMTDYRRGNSWSIRYAMAVFAQQPSCQACHSGAQQASDAK